MKTAWQVSLMVANLVETAACQIWQNGQVGIGSFTGRTLSGRFSLLLRDLELLLHKLSLTVPDLQRPSPRYQMRARATSGQVAAAPLKAPRNSRRLMSAPRLRRRASCASNECFDRAETGFVTAISDAARCPFRGCAPETRQVSMQHRQDSSADLNFLKQPTFL